MSTKEGSDTGGTTSVIVTYATVVAGITLKLILSALSVKEFYLSTTTDMQKLGAFGQTTADQNNRQIDLQDNRPKATAVI